jgi:hypothetical protein
MSSKPITVKTKTKTKTKPFSYKVTQLTLYDLSHQYKLLFEPYYYNNLTKEMLHAIESYKHNGFDAINGLLRTRTITKLSLNDFIAQYHHIHEFKKEVNKRTLKGRHIIGPASTSSTSTSISREKESKNKELMDIPVNIKKSKGLRQIIYDTVWHTLTHNLKQAQLLDNAFRSSPSLHSGIILPTLFRGIGRTHAPKESYSNWKIGTDLKFPTYMSTSLSPSVAWEFQGCGKKPCCLMVLRINPLLTRHIPWLYINTQILYGPRGNIDDEHEILLPRNTMWRLMKKYPATLNPDSALGCTFADIDHANPVMIYECELQSCEFGKLHYPDAHTQKKMLNFEINIKTPMLIEEDL